MSRVSHHLPAVVQRSGYEDEYLDHGGRDLETMSELSEAPTDNASACAVPTSRAGSGQSSLTASLAPPSAMALVYPLLRLPRRGTAQTRCEAILNLLNNLLGAGLLAMPRAMADAGLVSGLFVMGLVAVANRHTLLQVLWMSHSVLGSEKCSYPELGRHVFGQKGLIAVLIGYILFTGGILSAYLVVLVDLFRQLTTLAVAPRFVLVAVAVLVCLPGASLRLTRRIFARWVKTSMAKKHKRRCEVSSVAAMARDKPMDLGKQQLKWEKKKEKMEKREKTERGAMRKTEKDLKKLQKEELQREQKDERPRATDPKVHVARAALTVFYAVSVVLGFRRWAEESSEAPLSQWMAGLSVLTLVWILLLTAVEAWQARLEKVAAQKDAADAIKDTLERKHQEKEREAQSHQRRQLLQREARERQLRREEEEATALNAARELARSLRWQREEREAAERKAQKEMAAQQEGSRDEHGWMQTEYQALKQAVRQYPESWSHSRKQRWEMIASEVGRHGARACEECFARLEAQKISETESKAGKDLKESVPRGLEHDLDWLEDASATASLDWFPTEEDDEEEEEEEEEIRNERMPIELEPDHKGTEIRLEGIKTMQGCATVQLELLHLQLACSDCRSTAKVYLSGADEDAADAKLWCEGCSGLIAARLRPTLLHPASSRLCYVDCVRCRVTDVLPSVLMSACDKCHAENVHKNEFVRNRGIDGTCFECHAKYAFRAESIRIDEITPCDPGGRSSGDDPMDELAEELRYLRKKAKSDPRQQLIKLGSPLPQMGACRHFKKSYKWYRFACCGRAFPCPQCHADSGCPAAGLGAQASRMICGKCSMEQSYSPARPCEKCGFAMVAKGSAHWDDGGGTRSITAMSTKDSRKFKGGLRQANSKNKTSSSKAERVGVKAKARREHEKKSLRHVALVSAVCMLGVCCLVVILTCVCVGDVLSPNLVNAPVEDPGRPGDVDILRGDFRRLLSGAALFSLQFSVQAGGIEVLSHLGPEGDQDDEEVVAPLMAAEDISQIAFLIALVFSAVTGTAAYLRFGDKVAGNVLLDFSPVAPYLPLMLSWISYGFVVICSFAFIMVPCRSAAVDVFALGRRNDSGGPEALPKDKFHSLNAVILAICGLVAWLISDLSKVLTFVGVWATMALAFVLPGAFTIELRRRQEGMPLVCAANIVPILLIAFGLLVAFTSTLEPRTKHHQTGAHDLDKPGINKDATTTLLPVPPNKPKGLSPRSLMALRSQRFTPSPADTQNAGPGFCDALCSSQEKGELVSPSLLQLQAFHEQKEKVRERLHGFALCWGRQEEREVKVREMFRDLHDIFDDDCTQNAAVETLEDRRSPGPPEFAPRMIWEVREGTLRLPRSMLPGSWPPSLGSRTSRQVSKRVVREHSCRTSQPRRVSPILQRMCELAGLLTCTVHSAASLRRTGFRSSLREAQTYRLVRSEVAKLWPSKRYDLIHCNCIHFCEDLAQRLGAKPVPGWVRGLHETGAAAASLVRGASAMGRLLLGRGPHQ
eukprot:s5932_g1.t3